MRQEEEYFVNFISNITVEQLLAPAEEYYDELQQGRKYLSIVRKMTNSFIFHPQEVLNAVYSRRLENVMRLLTLTWVEAMAKRYTSVYWDERDKAAVRLCHDIAAMESFWATIHKEYQMQHLSKSRQELSGKDTVVSVYTAVAMSDLHPTLRQSFTGFLLSFMIKDRAMEVIRLEAQEKKLIGEDQKSIHFLMI